MPKPLDFGHPGGGESQTYPQLNHILAPQEPLRVALSLGIWRILMQAVDFAAGVDETLLRLYKIGMNENQKNLFQQLSGVIEARKTLKVLGNTDTGVDLGSDVGANQALVREALATSGWAPFHYDRNVEGMAEPWRAHVLWHENCRTIASKMRDWFPDMKPTNKLPAMLSACGALVLVTWIPQTADEISDETKCRDVNEEHLAATAAMVQNFLLLLTAAGYGSYWSSGGQFRSQEMFRRLNMPESERLSAAVFVEFPQSQAAEVERLPGKNRKKRSTSQTWLRTITNVT